MIKVSVLYPDGDGIHFDMAYYLGTHLPMVLGHLGSACKKTEVEKGMSGVSPGSRPTYIAMAHLYFESIAEFERSFASHAQEILMDVPKFTNADPVIQVSAVMKQPA